MEYSRDKGILEFELKSSTIKDLGAYFRKIIDIISASYISEENLLRPREKDCLIAACILNTQGIVSLNHKDSKKVFKEFGFKTKSSIKTNFTRIKNKEWGKLEDNKIILPSFFEDVNPKVDKCTFVIDLKYEAVG